MDENEKYVPENPALEPELREVPEVPEVVEENEMCIRDRSL